MILINQINWEIHLHHPLKVKTIMKHIKFKKRALVLKDFSKMILKDWLLLNSQVNFKFKTKRTFYEWTHQ